MKKVSADKLERAIKIREKISSERPAFHRSEYTRFPRLGDKWRSSKGIRSKMRLKKRSRAAIVETGYRGPVIARGLRTDGRSEVLVHCIGDLSGVDASSQVIRLGGDVGKRKRLEIIAKAKELELYIVNIRVSEKGPPKVEEEEEEKKPEAKEEEAETEEETEEETEKAEETKPVEVKEELKPAKKSRSKKPPKKKPVEAEKEPEAEEAEKEPEAEEAEKEPEAEEAEKEPEAEEAEEGASQDGEEEEE